MHRYKKQKQKANGWLWHYIGTNNLKARENEIKRYTCSSHGEEAWKHAIGIKSEYIIHTCLWLSTIT